MNTLLLVLSCIGLGLFYVNFFLLVVWGLPSVLGRGVTRTVVKVANVAVKLPVGLAGYSPWKLLRGIMANQSEWQQRNKRDDILKPLWTLFYIIQAYPVARPMVSEPSMWGVAMRLELIEQGYSAEEAGYTAWMWFGDNLVLVDYDRSDEEPRSRLARLYYWNEDRKYNKWVRDGIFDLTEEEVGPATIGPFPVVISDQVPDNEIVFVDPNNLNNSKMIRFTNNNPKET